MRNCPPLEEKELLDELAERVVAQQSFQYDSFKNAKCTERVAQFEYVFDRLSLCYYHFELGDYPLYFFSAIKKRCLKRMNREAQKARLEYAILFQLAISRPDFFGYHIEKHEHPDFYIVNHGRKTGLEVTQFIPDEDAVLDKIVGNCFGQGKTAEEIKELAIAKHGSKAQKYDYTDVGDGVAAIGRSDGVAIQSAVELFATQLIRKFDMYKGKPWEFDELAILCDAQKGIYVTSQGDSDEIIEIAKKKRHDLKGVTVYILWQDNNGVKSSAYCI